MKKTIAETERHRLPSFDCPNPDCRAKHIVFATSQETKNETELIPLDDFSDVGEADFVITCPKCKQQYVLYRHRERPIISIYDLRHYTGIAT